jgi:predicted nucleic acid-binding protein
MNGKAFVDTNIIIYLYSIDEKDKSSHAVAMLKK